MDYLQVAAVAKRKVSDKLFFEILGIGMMMALTADLWRFISY